MEAAGAVIPSPVCLGAGNRLQELFKKSQQGSVQGGSETFKKEEAAKLIDKIKGEGWGHRQFRRHTNEWRTQRKCYGCSLSRKSASGWIPQLGVSCKTLDFIYYMLSLMMEVLSCVLTTKSLHMATFAKIQVHLAENTKGTSAPVVCGALRVSDVRHMVKPTAVRYPFVRWQGRRRLTRMTLLTMISSFNSRVHDAGQSLCGHLQPT